MRRLHDNPSVLRVRRSKSRAAERLWPCVALFCLAAIGSCSERPTDPAYDNVFDLRGPSGGDPFEIEAAFVPGGVLVTFRELGVDEVTAEVSQYEILYSVWPDSLFKVAGDVPPGDEDRASYLDFNYVGNTEMFYKVRARTVEDSVSNFKVVQAASAVTPPRLLLVAGGNRTQTRFPVFRVETLTDEPLEVASDPSFADAVLVDDLESENTDPTTSPVLGIYAAEFSWDLGPGNDGDTLVTYVRTRNLPVAAKTDSLRLVVAFTPTLPPLPPAIYDNRLDMLVATTGVTRMRFADTVEQLPSVTWVIPSADPDRVEYTLSTALDPPRLFAEFEGDFGITVTDSVFFETLDVGPAEFIIDDGTGVTTHPERKVMIASSVSNATEMRFSESPDFLQVDWIAYQDTLAGFTLSEGPGEKTIYGWYRNPFDTPGRGTQSTVTLLGEGSP